MFHFIFTLELSSRQFSNLSQVPLFLADVLFLNLRTEAGADVGCRYLKSCLEAALSR